MMYNTGLKQEKKPFKILISASLKLWLTGHKKNKAPPKTDKCISSPSHFFIVFHCLTVVLVCVGV